MKSKIWFNVLMAVLVAGSFLDGFLCKKSGCI